MHAEHVVGVLSCEVFVNSHHQASTRSLSTNSLSSNFACEGNAWCGAGGYPARH